MESECESVSLILIRSTSSLTHTHTNTQFNLSLPCLRNRKSSSVTTDLMLLFQRFQIYGDRQPRGAQQKKTTSQSNYFIVGGTLLYCYWYTALLPFTFNHISWCSPGQRLPSERGGQWISEEKTQSRKDCVDSISFKTITIRSLKEKKWNLNKRKDVRKEGRKEDRSIELFRNILLKGKHPKIVHLCAK